MSANAPEPLAVLGLACRLPGADDPAKLYQAALAGTRALRACPQTWAEQIGLPEPALGGFLEDRELDWKRFKLPPADAEHLHRMVRVLLEALASCLDDADAANAWPSLARCAFYVGSTGVGIDPATDSSLALHSPQLDDALRAALQGEPGAMPLAAAVGEQVRRAAAPFGPESLVPSASISAGLVAGLHDTKGGHLAVDAGMASGLAALHLGAQSLYARHCDLAVVGGLAPQLSASTFALLRARGWLAGGTFAPLDDRADGTLPGEGAAAVLLCRLEDALRLGRPVRAVLQAVRCASAPAQQGLSKLSSLVDRAARMALEACDLEPGSVRHIEAQACGVRALEDQELHGLAAAYGLRRTPAATVSSAAAQVGFQQAASGLVSVLRAVLAIEHGQVAPTAGLTNARSHTQALRPLGRPEPLDSSACVAVSSPSWGGQAYHALFTRVPSSFRAASPRPKPKLKIAIVGAGAIAPGASDARALWNNVLAKVDAIKDLPASRFDVTKLLNPILARDQALPRLAGTVDLPKLDPATVRLPPATIEELDPAVVLALAAGEEAVRSAGFQEGRWERHRVKVIFGQLPMRMRELELERRYLCERYLGIAAKALEAGGLPAHRIRAVLQAVRESYCARLPAETPEALQYYSGLACASRLAARFGFTGEVLSIDAACASALAAVHAGALALERGDADVVVAGGVAYNLAPEYYANLCALGALSARGCFPFDDRADGFVPSEGAGAVVLKRLEAAEAAGDRILAVISGIGFSSDGSGASLRAPVERGQALAVDRALESAEVDPSSPDLIEGHGSATRRGDVCEATAYGRVFAARGRDNPIALGAIKSQIGHLSSAGGMMGLIKVAFALSEKVLPPMNGGEYPNPDLDFERLPLALSLEARPWRLPPSGVRRAGVSSFGLGGSNYHLLLEEHDNLHLQARQFDPSPGPYPVPARGLLAGRWAVDLVPLSLPRQRHFDPAQKRLIVLGEGEPARAMAEALARRHARVAILSTAGLRDPAEVERQVTAAARSLEGADGIIDLGAFGSMDYFLSLGSERFAGLLAEASARWFGAARALYPRFAADRRRETCYLAVTSMGGDFGFVGDGGNVLGGASAGFLKGLKQELPGVVFKVVDFDPLSRIDAVVDAAVAELEEGGDRVEIAYLGGRRMGIGMRRAAFAEDQIIQEVDPSWVLLFSGGGRGAVFEVAKAIARLGSPVVVTGRTPLPKGDEPYLQLEGEAFEAFRVETMLRQKQADPTLTPARFARAFGEIERARELWFNLAGISASGVLLRYEVCDIRDPAQVRALTEKLRRDFGHIDGVVHGAMVEESKSLPDKTREIVDATLAIKVGGLVNLLEATRRDDLKLVMCFGSGAGRFGNRGQSDYCAANDQMSKCLMAYAARARPGARYVTIDWTAWESVGAAVRNRHIVEGTGVSFIPPAEGCYWFVNELMLGTEREVAIFDERLFREWPFLGASAEGPRSRRAWDDRGGLLVPSDYPMLEEVIETGPDSLTAQRLFRLSRDRFLAQHQLYGVPIMPATFGFELLAEGAALLRPERSLLRSERLTIETPLKFFRDQSVLVRLHARVLSEDEERSTIEVETSSEMAIGPHLQRRVHQRGVFVFGPQPQAGDPHRGGGLPQGLPGARARSIFHLSRDPVHLGPMFCRAEWVFVGENTVEGIIPPPREREVFTDLARPFFRLDPLVLDSAFQVAANWDGHNRNLVSIPISVAAIHRGRMRQSSERVHVKSWVLKVVEHDVFSDIEIRGEDGALLLRVERLCLRRLPPQPRSG